MLLHFTKMHGLGNDFMVVDMVSQNIRITPEKVRQLSDRRLGVGFDQLLLIEPPSDPDMDFCYRIFNADGNEVEQCGNGARCCAQFVRDNHLIGRDLIRVQTLSGNIELRIKDNGHVLVNMGIPQLSPSKIPLSAPQESTLYTLDIGSKTINIAAVSVGNPHAVLVVEDIDKAPVNQLGPLIQKHANFPKQCNVGFMKIASRNEINLRVYERGVGETPSCGSGACAAVVAGIIQGILDQEVKVNLQGGVLHIKWLGRGYPIMMEGGTTKVYKGHIRL